MSEDGEPRHYERYEKEEEKSEKEHEEKNWDEKWQRDPLSAARWACFLIWIGLMLLAEQLGLTAGLEWFDAGGAILVGIGVILLGEAALRTLVPAYRRPVTLTLIIAVVALSFGLGNLLDLKIVLPVILIAVGVIGLVRGLFRRL